MNFARYRNFTRTYVIAEIGVNHDGSVCKAKNLVDMAVESGADAVKFQSFRAEDLATPDTPKVNYQNETTAKELSHFQMLKNLELSDVDEEELFAYCLNKGVNFISTPYSVAAVKKLDALGVSEFKVASADIVDIPLLEAIADTGKPVILSLGMASIGEIETALSKFAHYESENIVLLHCVSNYPCSDESLNLNVIDTLRNTFKLPVGFSDHSFGPLAAAISVSMGASVVEKHFTLDKSLNGPDHRASSDPVEFSELTSIIRRSQVQLGSSKKTLQIEEAGMHKNSRKSLVYATAISKGCRFKSTDFTMKRPGTGLSWSDVIHFIGQRARYDCSPNTLASFKDLD